MSLEEAYQQFMTPGRPAPRARREQELADRGTPLGLTVFEQMVRGHCWCDSETPRGRILVQHGWGSRGTAMWALIKPLLLAGFEVYAFDAPGHGDSESEHSTMFQFAETMRVAGETFGPFFGVVTHSIASAGLPLALSQGLVAERVAILSPRNDIAKFLTRFLELAGFSPTLFDGVKDVWDRALGWDRVMAATPSRIVPSLSQSALIIHDRDDEDVHYGDSEIIHQAWPGSKLVLTNGLGHARIVRSEEVATHVATFMVSWPRG